MALGFLLMLPRAIVVLTLVLQIIDFWVVWVWSAPVGNGESAAPPVQMPLLVVGCLSALGLLWHFGRSIARNQPQNC